MYTGEDGKAIPTVHSAFWGESDRDRAFASFAPSRRSLHYTTEEIVDVDVVKKEAISKLSPTEKFVLGVS